MDNIYKELSASTAVASASARARELNISLNDLSEMFRVLSCKSEGLSREFNKYKRNRWCSFMSVRKYCRRGSKSRKKMR